MDIQQHEQLIQLLAEYKNQKASVAFTQWDTDSEEEEEVTQFQAELLEVKLTDNEFEEKDLLLVFTTAEGEEMEILMEIPGDEVDLASYEEGHLRIFGTESEIVLQK
ncbi:hypothetical protein HP398_28275 [Brevibacillus sp. HB1.4B]|uniref:hypothetical protein n=1 Tax=Brevibacillus TaxID=55080 RepID=UPI000375D7FC|nr:MULTISPECIES: hypothetical protein [unclassified Brevibacillus]ATF12691.1 hypothetical protein A616_12045 [Brevibacillus brevis X23]NRS20318.1 hypothetical protein [Brevibacillus sp. HB1.4B]NTU30416.1 hypothetical protein [Brevibacillus sp. HB1.1]